MESAFFELFQILLYGFIGYGTNWLALKMLFFPYQQKKLFGLNLPFTPGLIPRERYRLSQAIGNVVAERLLSKQDMQEALTNLRLNEKIAHATIEVIKEKAFATNSKDEGGLGEVFLKNFIHSVRGSKTVENAVIDKLKPFLEKESGRILDIYTPKIIEEIDVRELIIKKVDSLDIEEIEGLILKTASKEFRYITILGGVIGLFIGLVQFAFSG